MMGINTDLYLQQVAWHLRLKAEKHGAAPEGIELFEWFWVAYNIPILNLPASYYRAQHPSMDLPDRPEPPKTFQIMGDKIHWTVDVHDAMKARCGWSSWHGTAVLFFAGGGSFKGGK